MTRSNLYITLSNGAKLHCVADGSSAPEQGYIVEQLILPLLQFNDNIKETALLAEHCELNELRTNADYRYTINLLTKEVRFYEEQYNYRKDVFTRGKDITERYEKYLSELQTKSDNL